jgi:hypothetical protein
MLYIYRSQGVQAQWLYIIRLGALDLESFLKDAINVFNDLKAPFTTTADPFRPQAHTQGRQGL